MAYHYRHSRWPTVSDRTAELAHPPLPVVVLLGKDRSRCQSLAAPLQVTSAQNVRERATHANLVANARPNATASDPPVDGAYIPTHNVTMVMARAGRSASMTTPTSNC